MKNYRFFVVTKQAKRDPIWKGCSYVRAEVTKNGGFVSELATFVSKKEDIDVMDHSIPCSLVLQFKNMGDLKEVSEAELALII